MPNPGHEPETRDEPGTVGPTRSGAGVPRWVKGFALVTATVALLLLILMLVAGGSHGPGRHLSSGADPATVGAGAATALPGGQG